MPFDSEPEVGDIIHLDTREQNRICGFLIVDEIDGQFLVVPVDDLYDMVGAVDRVVKSGIVARCNHSFYVSSDSIHPGQVVSSVAPSVAERCTVDYIADHGGDGTRDDDLYNEWMNRLADVCADILNQNERGLR